MEYRGRLAEVGSLLSHWDAEAELGGRLATPSLPTDSSLVSLAFGYMLDFFVFDIPAVLFSTVPDVNSVFSCLQHCGWKLIFLRNGF